MHLASAPKSNSVTTALAAATAAVRSGPMASVPAHLRDAHYRGASALGHGVGYRYPHDDPSGWVDQRYLPAELGDQRFYEPSPHGREGTVWAWREAAQRDGTKGVAEGGEARR